MVRNPLFCENISPAALARIVEQQDGTMLIDEIDTALGPQANKESAETLRGILNSGYHKSGTYVRMVGAGTNMQPRKFSTYGPKVLAGLGHLPETIASRSVPIRIRRARPNECTRFRPDGNGQSAQQLRSELEKLRVRAARWAKCHQQQIADAQPGYPAEFTDRQCDISEPLLAIAAVLGDPWPERIRAALTQVFSALAAEDTSKGVLLLGHIRKAFLDLDKNRLHSESLIAALCALPEAPWAEWKKGKNLNARGLARLLKEFEIRSTTVRAPGAERPGKGYKLEDFYDSFERYLRPVCTCPIVVKGVLETCRCHEACNGTCKPPEDAAVGSEQETSASGATVN